MATMFVTLDAVRALQAEEISIQSPSPRPPTQHTRSIRYLKNNPISWVERKSTKKKIPSLRSKFETGVLNPNSRASILIVIVFMIVSPKIVASDVIMSPVAANCTGDLNVSGMRGAEFCEIPTPNEGSIV